MKVGVVIVTHSVSPENAIRSLKSAVHDIDLRVFFHGPSEQMLQHVAALTEEARGTLYPYKSNRGLARSWNEGINASLAEGADAVLLLNDDCFFLKENGFDQFLAFAENDLATNPCPGIVLTNGIEPFGGNVVRCQGFACVLIYRNTLDSVGAFDENFCPAYFEDLDYARRVELSGRVTSVCPDVLVQHERGQTTRQNDALREAITTNAEELLAYYLAKWGGATPETLRFRLPFNRFPLKIKWSERAAPYGRGYDRPILTGRANGRALEFSL